jgi:DNA anti-recombination protein RmuC
MGHDRSDPNPAGPVHTPAAARAGPGPPGVVSVSAREAPPDLDLTVQVVPETVRGSTETLRGLLDAAGGSAVRLGRLLDDVRRTDAHSVRASMILQERLRVGASLLRAFQRQIEQAEAAITSLESRQRDLERVQTAIDGELSAYRSRLASIGDGYEQRFAAMVEAATASLLRELDRREQRILELARALDGATAERAGPAGARPAVRPGVDGPPRARG